jgi:hypothetical protein
VDERWGPDDAQGGDSIVLHDGNSEKLVCPCIYVLNVTDAFEHAHDSALTQTLADTRTNRYFKILVVQNNMQITVHRLSSNRFEINFLPRSAHLSQLLGSIERQGIWRNGLVCTTR